MGEKVRNEAGEMSGFVAFLGLIACLVGLAWMTGPEWCPGSDLANAPICSGATND